MDEEELEQPKQKINVGSFFEKADSIEKVSNRALSQSSANFSIINNQKLIINSINVSIEALETKIRDIANYIIIEKKIEKNIEEDRALEEQDRLQKQAMVERATTIMGQPVQEEGGAQPEQQKGGSLLGTLLKLGIAAFAIKFLWPVILPLAGGLLKGALAKFAIFSIGGIGTLLKGLIVGTLGSLGIFGLGKLFTNLGNNIEDNFKNAGKKAGDNIEKFKLNKDGTVEGGEDVIDGESGKKVQPENNLLEGGKDMKKTLEKKDLIEKETSESTYKVGKNPEKDKLITIINKEIKELERKEEESLVPDNLTEILARKDTLMEAKENLQTGDTENEFGGYDYLQNFLKEQNIKVEGNKEPFAADKVGEVDLQSKEYLEAKRINESLKIEPVDSDMTQAIAKTNERIDNLIGGENKEQNNGNLVSANKPNVTEATLKLASAPLPFVKVIKNNQLSTSPKSYNGLPPEIAAMIS